MVGSEPRLHLVVLHVSVGPIFQQQKCRLHVVDSRCPVKSRFSCKRNVRVSRRRRGHVLLLASGSQFPVGSKDKLQVFPPSSCSRNAACRLLSLQRTSRDEDHLSVVPPPSTWQNRPCRTENGKYVYTPECILRVSNGAPSQGIRLSYVLMRVAGQAAHTGKPFTDLL